ncbi:MAG: GGDEF domain-containing protein [Clostridia bacterium]|nr:GGDEF domain-containing protein [Clostridia bacterium]
MKKNLSLTTQVVIIVAVLLLVVNAALGAILMTQSQKALIEQIDKRMLDISNTAAAMIDGDEFDTLTDDTTTPEYIKIYNTLKYFQDNIECDYIYGVRKSPDSDTDFIFVVDPSDDPGEYGTTIVFTQALLNASQGVADVDNIAYEDEWGTFYSSFSPIKNSEGKVVGIIGVDFNKEWYDDIAFQSTYVIVLSLFGSLVVGVIIVIISMAGVRAKFKKVNKDLSALAGSIDILTEKIDVDSEDRPAEETEPFRVEGGFGDDRAVGNEIGRIGDKVNTMRETLDKFLTYMNKKAYTDTLTGVNNSAAYYEVVEDMNAKIKEGSASFAVIVFDLNGLKRVNDDHGHAIGDTFIISAVEIMVSVLGRDKIYRVGGDEFIVVIENVKKEEVQTLFDKIDVVTIRVNERPRPFDDKITFAKGFSLYDKSTDKAFRDVFRRAAEKMYQDKAEFHKKFG